MHYPPKRGACIVAWSASLWRARRWRKKDASAQASTPMVSLTTGERSLSECIACTLVLGLQGPSGHVRSSTRPYPQPLMPGSHSCRPGHGHRVRCADMMSAPSVHRSPGCAASLAYRMSTLLHHGYEDCSHTHDGSSRIIFVRQASPDCDASWLLIGIEQMMQSHPPRV